LFRVRSGLRELSEAGLASQKGDRYELSAKGGELLSTSST
jgi:predicted transcriptional regulator